MDIKLKSITNSIIKVANPDKIILFGSRAKGKQKNNSDYDICVLRKKIKYSRRLAQKIYLSLDVNASVDIVVTTPSRFNQLKDKWFLFYSDIDRYGKVIYEK